MMSQAPLRVAAVRYLNSAPLVWGLEHGPYRERFQVEYTVPSRCADLLRASEADAGIIPSIEYQRIRNLKIVPGLSVSSCGPVRSVLLISRCPLQAIQSIAVDTASRTSACLLEILLDRHFHILPLLVPHDPDLERMLRERDAALIIGDPALASDFPGLQVWDMATEWRKMTGLPFVFAFWALRAEAATPDWVPAFQQSTVYALAHLNEIIEQETRRTGLTPELIRSYLTENIDFSLGEENLKGLRLFYSLAEQLGLTPATKPLEFVG